MTTIEKRTVVVRNEPIAFEVRRSTKRRKTMEIKVSADGVAVYAPMGAAEDYIDNFVRDRADWIIDTLGRFDVETPYGVADRQAMPYLGQALDVRWDRRPEATGVTVSRIRHLFVVTGPQGMLAGDVEQAFARWYRAAAKPYLQAKVTQRWPDMTDGGTEPAVLISNAKKRWGSCSAKARRVRFAYRLMMVDEDLADTVVVHELAHMRYQNHSPQYWRWVAKFRPDQATQHARLKKTGLTLPLG